VAPNEDVPSEYSFCQRFRRWSKRVAALPAGPGEIDEDTGRSALIEEIWEFGASLYVWGTADHLSRVLRCIYDREDAMAVALLRELADDELKALQQSDQEEEPEDPE
jgi:hypothetical protein